MADETRSLTNPERLALDFTQMYFETRNESKLLYSMMMGRNGAAVDVLVRFMEWFYGLWDSCSHHLSDDRNKEMQKFFDEMRNWENERDEEEEDYVDELFSKCDKALDKWKEFKRVCEKKGWLNFKLMDEYEKLLERN